MLKIDYSVNADLYEYEEYDWDTVRPNETGINDDRMRLPTQYDIAKFYKRYRRKNKYGKREEGRWVNKKKADLPDFSDEFEWQITYKFNDHLRIPTTPTGDTYGGNYITLRRLYLILCERLNGGKFFIDEYFNDVYPYTIKGDVDARLKNLKREIMAGYIETAEDFGVRVTKKGVVYKADRRKRGLRKVLNDYSVQAQEWENREGKEIADMIREHIAGCLESGQIPLEIEYNKPRTNWLREHYGLPEEPRFYATGQLINNLVLFVRIRGKGEWRKPTRILG